MFTRVVRLCGTLVGDQLATMARNGADRTEHVCTCIIVQKIRLKSKAEAKEQKTNSMSFRF